MPYIMAVDLGGTNCRFAGFTLDKGILSLHRMGKRKTAELPDTGALISACGTALDRHPRTADAFVVGMAGPVADPLKARLTNAPLEVDLTDAGERYGIRSCRIINDFTAEACACLTEAGSSAHCVLGAPGPRPDGPIGIIGAGTGPDSPVQHQQRWKGYPTLRAARRAASSSPATGPVCSASLACSLGSSASVPSISRHTPPMAMPKTPWPPCRRSMTSSLLVHS